MTDLDLAAELDERWRAAHRGYLLRRQRLAQLRAELAAARRQGKAAGHLEKLRRSRVGDTTKESTQMTTTTTTWRSYHGAQYRDPTEIPCKVIANRYLVDEAGDPVGEEHPDLVAEIERRGRTVYRDHGYGDGHEVPGWGAVSVSACDHTVDDRPAIGVPLASLGHDGRCDHDGGCTAEATTVMLSAAHADCACGGFACDTTPASLAFLCAAHVNEEPIAERVDAKARFADVPSDHPAHVVWETLLDQWPAALRLA